MKPGIKTSEFWLSLVAALVPLLEFVQGHLPTQWAALVGAIVAAAYAVSRGMVKAAAK